MYSTLFCPTLTKQSLDIHYKEYRILIASVFDGPNLNVLQYILKFRINLQDKYIVDSIQLHSDSSCFTL